VDFAPTGPVDPKLW